MGEPVRIEKPIASCAVVTAPANQVRPFKRDPVLEGATYKLKAPVSEHAVYVTINHTVVDGTPRLMEIFVNSKNMDHFAWVVALTRVISAIFRHEPRPTFLVSELRSVFDPKGGYWEKGRYVPSLVAGIGDCLQRHMERLGIAEQSLGAPVQAIAEEASGTKPQAICESCGAFAVVFSGGCDKCLECGFSKRCGDA